MPAPFLFGFGRIETMRIETATERDIDAIVELWNEMMMLHAELDERFELAEDARAAYERYLRFGLNESNQRVLVARDGDTLVGYISAEIKNHPPVYQISKYGEIGEIAVAVSHRRRGAGGALVAAAGDWLRERGIQHVTAAAASCNEDAICFWTKQGFEGYFTVMAAEVGPAVDENDERQ